MKKSRYYSMFILVMYITFIFTSCSKEPLKIGLMYNLTGRASGIGISGRNGAEIAVDEINRNGGIHGRKISLIIKDDKGLPEEAVKVDKELIEEDILLGIGHCASGTGLAGLKVFSEANKLMVSPTMSVEGLTGIDDNFIHIIGSNKKQGEVLADAALSINGNRKIAIMFESNNAAYSQSVCNYFKQVYKKGSGQIVMEESFVSSSSMDFDRIADRIVESGAEGALIVAGGLDLAIITQKIKLKNPEIDIYSGMWAMTEELITNGGKFVEGVILPGVYDRNSKAPSFLSFRDAYMKANNEEPTFSSIYAYETVYMISEALKACGNKLDTASIKQKLLEIGKYKGLQDNFSIDKYGDTNRGYSLFRVSNAEFQRVE